MTLIDLRCPMCGQVVVRLTPMPADATIAELTVMRDAVAIQARWHAEWHVHELIAELA